MKLILGVRTKIQKLKGEIMDNKKKKFNTNRLAAYALSGVMLASVVPYNVFANTEKLEDTLQISKEIKPVSQKAGEDKTITEDQKKKAVQSANNWDEEIAVDNDYWKVPVGYNKAKNMGGLSNGVWEPTK